MMIILIWGFIICYFGFQVLIALIGLEVILNALAPAGRLIKKISTPLFHRDNLKVLAQVAGLLSLFLIQGFINLFH